MDPPPQHRGRLPKKRRSRAPAEPISPPLPPPPPPAPKPKKPAAEKPAAEKPATPRKRKAASDDDGEEKRLKRYRDHAPQSVMVKWERVMTQRMFMLERSGRKDGALSEDFSVLGSTGNVYVVNVSQVPTCTCPDFVKNRVHCKHIIFVFVKVLKLSAPLWFQAAFLTSELEAIFAKVEDSRHAVSHKVRDQYKSIAAGESTADEAIERKALEGDCPICFEDLSESTLEDTVYCRAMCGNNLHKECFNQWARSKRQEGVQVTCVYCRTVWENEKGKGKANGAGDDWELDERVGDDGYMNLGKLVGASPVRDTSTYHNWGYASWGYARKGRR